MGIGDHGEETRRFRYYIIPRLCKPAGPGSALVRSMLVAFSLIAGVKMIFHSPKLIKIVSFTICD